MSRRVLLGCSATFLGAFDFGFLVLASPALEADLDLGADYAWLFGAASFAYGAVVMPAGAQAGRIAPSRILALGLLLAAVGTAVLAVANGLATSLAARVLFGLGGGIAAAPALALLAAIEPPSARRAGFAHLGAAVAVGFTAGVLSGALVAPALGWRFVLAPTAAALATLAWRSFRFDSALGQRQRVPGAWLIGAATVAAAVCLASVDETLSLGLASLGAAIVLAWTAWRRADRWRPSAHGATFAALTAAGATTASGVGATVLLARSIPVAADATPAVTGLVLSAFGLAVLPSIAVAQRLAARLDASASAGVGLAVQALGLAVLAAALAGTGQPLVLTALVAVFGAGHMVANAGVADAVTGLARESAGAMGGLLVTAQYVGAGTGSLVLLGIADRHDASLGLLVAVGIAGAGAAVTVPRASRGFAARR